MIRRLTLPKRLDAWYEEREPGSFKLKSARGYEKASAVFHREYLRLPALPTGRQAVGRA